jgi:hypothetical protein
MTFMKGFCLFLLLMLTVAVDLSAPLAPEAMEDLRGSQEVIRVAAARQPVRLAWDVSVPLGVIQGSTVTVQLVPHTNSAPPPRPVTSRRVRKIPPPVSDSPFTPEDH